MRVAVFSTNPKNFYSGGRYHGAIAAFSLASAGAKVDYITNNNPIFVKDLQYICENNPLDLYITPDWVNGLPSSDCDVVIIVPSAQMDRRFYGAARRYAAARNAKLVLINFESPNWFNSMVKPPRAESLWAEWWGCCEDGCLILSSAHESDKWAKEYYTQFPERTFFAVWQPPVNGVALGAVPPQGTRDQIFLMARPRDNHKGGADALQLMTPEFKGETFTFLFGGKETDQEFIDRLQARADETGIHLRILRSLTDLEKFTELSRAKALVFPSLFEGYGYPPIEAMAAGAVPICYDLPVVREMCGDIARYASPGDIIGLRDVLAEALTQLRPSEANFARQVGDIANPRARGEALLGILESYLRQREAAPPRKKTKLGFTISEASQWGNGARLLRGWCEHMQAIRSLRFSVGKEAPVEAVLHIKRTDVSKRLGAKGGLYGFFATWPAAAAGEGPLHFEATAWDGTLYKGELPDIRFAPSDALVKTSKCLKINETLVSPAGATFLKGQILPDAGNVRRIALFAQGVSFEGFLGDALADGTIPFVAYAPLPKLGLGQQLILAAVGLTNAGKLVFTENVAASVNGAPKQNPTKLGASAAELTAEAEAIEWGAITVAPEADDIIVLGAIRTLQHSETALLLDGDGEILGNAQTARGDGCEVVASLAVPRESFSAPFRIALRFISGGRTVAEKDCTQLVKSALKRRPQGASTAFFGIDSVRLTSTDLHISAWVASKRRDVTALIEVNGEPLGNVALNLNREDVRQNYPDLLPEGAPNGLEYVFRRDFPTGGPLTISCTLRSGHDVLGEWEAEEVPSAPIPLPPSAQISIGDLDWHSGELTEHGKNDHRLHVVVVMHVAPLPEAQGNRRVIMQLLRFLKSCDFYVTVVLQLPVGTVRAIADELLQTVHRVVVADSVVPRSSKQKRVSAADRFYGGTAEALAALHKERPIQAAIAQYVHMATALDGLPATVLKIIQTHDVLSRLPTQFAQIGEMVPGNRRVSPLDEARFFDHAHALIAITPEEAAEIRMLAPAKRILTVGFAYEGTKRAPVTSERKGQVLLFVGSSNPFNVLGVQRFCAEAWPHVRAAEPDAVFRIVGDVGSEAFPSPEMVPPGVVLVGRVEDLDAEYERADVVLNCTWNGTGLKIKTVEAIGYGKAIVCTPAAAEGVPALDISPLSIAHDLKAFVETVLALLGDGQMRRQLEQRSRLYAAKYLSMEAIYEPLRQFITAGVAATTPRVASPDRKLRDLVFAGLDALPRSIFSRPFGILLGSDVGLGAHMADWVVSRGLSLIGVFSDMPDTTLLRPELRVEPIEVIHSDWVPVLLLATTNSAELKTLEHAAHLRGIDTISLLPRSGLRDRQRMMAYGGAYAGKRCFVLGNGPSVRVSDLERLHGEFVFAANRFHLAYDKISFRPSFTACSDMLMAEQNGQDILERCGTPLFLEARAARWLTSAMNERIIRFDVLPRPPGTNGKPGVAFADDATVGLGNAGSIIYDLLQIAVWMGFTEIYLYGMDHTFRLPEQGRGVVKDGGEQNHFLPNYRRSGEVWYAPATELIDIGFEKAREECEKRGIIIRNATRGGALEIFERVDFDDVAPPSPPIPPSSSVPEVEA